MKSFLQTLLKYLAKSILWKYKPKVVAITGSVGKTSAREAIFTVLRTQFHVRRSRENYNNELGLPLSVINVQAPGRNAFLWAWAFIKGIFVLLIPVDYPEILILEMGADQPGDIDHLLSIAKPDFAVVTSVGESHLEFFGQVEKIVREKGKIVKALSDDGWAMLNVDNEHSYNMSGLNRGKTLYYGYGELADVRVRRASYTEEGLVFRIRYQGNSVPVIIPGAIGFPPVYAALAATAIGLSLEMNLIEIAQSLVEYKSLPGRMRLLPGVKSTYLIDDTYNSAPTSAIAAIAALNDFPSERKIAVVGDMAELGQFTEDGHREVGAAVVDHGINFLVTVGQKSKFTADQAIHMGFPQERIMSFNTADEAKKPVEKLMQPEDSVLIKGSQAMRMERVVKEVMAEPYLAERLLCRQSKKWLNTL